MLSMQSINMDIIASISVMSCLIHSYYEARGVVLYLPANTGKDTITESFWDRSFSL